jgi:hypothetical protein
MAVRTVTLPAGLTVKVLLYEDETGGDIWSVAGSAIVPYVAADIDNYDISTTSDSGSRLYQYTIPPTLPANTYREVFINQAGATITTTDLILRSRRFVWDTVGVSTPPSGSGPSAGTITVTTARAYLKRVARIAGSDDDYNPFDLDDAIFNALNEFLTETKMLKYTSILDADEDTPEITLSSLPSDWRPERILTVRLSDTDDDPIQGYAEALKNQGYDTIWERAACETTAGKPNAIGFDGWAVCRVHPTPDDDYHLHVRYWLSEVDWTHGGASVTLRTPYDMLYPVLASLGVVYLQGMEKDHDPLARAKRSEYELFKNKVMGQAGNLGEKSIQRMSLSTRRRYR